MGDYTEGQRLQGSDGNVYVVQGGVPVLAESSAPPVYGPAIGGNPLVPGQLTGQALTNQHTAAELGNVPLQRENIRTNIAQGQTTIQNTKLDNVNNMRKQFEAMQGVQDYRTILPQAASAFRSKDNKAGDLNLIYAFGKIMDPNSVVREGELNMATGVGGVAERVKGYIASVEGKGRLTPEQRHSLLDEIRNRGGALADAYNQARAYYKENAIKNGIDPEQVVGPHPGAPFQAAEAAYLGRPVHNLDGSEGPAPAGYVNPNAPPTPGATPQQPLGARDPATGAIDLGEIVGGQPNDYQHSTIGQGLSGVNVGAADLAGGPVDLAAGAINLGTRGINALANTNIDKITKPILGSEWIKEHLGNHVIFDPTNDPTQQFVRRVGESVGSSVFPAMVSATKLRALAQLTGGLAGGIGGATAQQVAPGNPYAEMAGELAGGGLAAGGMMRAGQRAAQRGIEAAVPTIDELKAQAGDLYRQAESRGVVAGPPETQLLSDNFRAALTKEGKISPKGRISEVYPKAKEAQQLIDDYAGQTMTPTQMQTVRKVASDGLSSPDNTERRLGRILTDTFDEWANPMAPELKDARGVASRYLTAEQLAQARELAGARAGQFTGSGFENALRTEYRGLDRKEIKDQLNLTPEVAAAVQKVSRGSPGSNFARGVGRLYPSGVVSGALGSGMPAIAAGMATGSPLVGGAVGATMAGAGVLGRAAATNMGLDAARQAELIARNGGNLITAPFATDDIVRMLRDAAMAQSAKYQAANP